jgi:hypothetical protein
MGRRETLFLALWLLLEVAAYFPLTPFPAVRRVLGPLVVLTLLAGRLAARTCRTPGRRRLLWATAAAGAALGLGFFGLDWWEARVQQVAAERAAAWAAEQGASSEGGEKPTIWFVGHWGFQYYAGAAGMRPLSVPPRTARECPRPGDWLVRPDDRVSRQDLDFDDPALEEVAWLRWDDDVPLETVVCFYSGRTPLRRRAGPRFVVRVYRVARPFTPRRTPPGG